MFKLDWGKHFRRLLDGTLAVLILGSLAVTAYYTYGLVLVLLALMWKFGDWISGLEDQMPSEEHSVEAYYSGGHGDPYYQPVLSCSCGFSSGRQFNWQDAGAELDKHLMAVVEED